MPEMLHKNIMAIISFSVLYIPQPFTGVAQILHYAKLFKIAYVGKFECSENKTIMHYVIFAVRTKNI